MLQDIDVRIKEYQMFFMQDSVPYTRDLARLSESVKTGRRRVFVGFCVSTLDITNCRWVL
jgi:hypothetical protein